MSEDDATTAGEDAILAGEYVLGTLHADERTVFSSVLTHDAAKRALVAAWHARLAPLAAAVPEVGPSPDVWARIELSLDAPSSGNFTVLEGGRAEPPSLAVPPTSADSLVGALRRSRRRWQAFAATASALAATLAIFIADREITRSPVDRPSYVAVVNRGGDEPALIVRVDLGTGQVFVRPVATEVPPGKSLELWYIGQGEAPYSMGLVDKGPLRMPLPSGARLEKATFAVTIEPRGGSPTGGPTGPIVYSGQLIAE